MSESLITFSEDISNAPLPPLLPPGPYPAEIIGAIRRTSATSGRDYAAITMRINADVFPADYIGDPDGVTLDYNFLQLVDTPQARYRLRRFLEKVGGPLGRSLDLNALIGLTCTVEISHQPPNQFSEEPRLQIARVLSP